MELKKIIFLATLSMMGSCMTASQVYYYESDFNSHKFYSIKGIKKDEIAENLNSEATKLTVPMFTLDKSIKVQKNPKDTNAGFTEDEVVNKLQLTGNNNMQNGCYILNGNFYHTIHGETNTPVYFKVKSYERCLVKN